MTIFCSSSLTFQASQLSFIKFGTHTFYSRFYSKQEIAKEFSELATQKKIDFVAKVSEDPGDVWFDRQILEKIAVNLISNSFKYTENGGSIKVKVLNSLKNFKPGFENELVLKNTYAGQK